MRAQFVMSEMLTGLRRNLTMTIAVIITVAISLTLAGAGWLIHKQVDTMKGYWYERVEVSIFLKDDVTQSQREALRSELDAMPEVNQVFYESKEDAYERFKEQFKDSPAIVENVTPAALPESFRVKLADPEDFEIVSSAFKQRAGVDTVLNQRELLKKFFRALNTFKWGAVLIAFLQLLAAAVLISNTIRVAAFSRRRETGIMRLVGASNLYIQLPFLLEGAIAGLVGAALASGLVSALMAWAVNGSLRDSFSSTPFIGWGDVLATIPLLLFFGVALSALASFVTLRKYLRV